MRVALDTRFKAGRIDLVVDKYARNVSCADFSQHFVDFGDLFVALWACGVDHMKQEIGVDRLLEGCAKRRDQRVGQIADESDGI